jgi:hypothetical protein
VFDFAVGADEQPPVIQHLPFTQVAAFVFPPRIEARIADNLGIASAFIEYSRNGVSGARLGLVRVPGTDQYRGAFPNTGGQAGDVFEYQIIAVDASRAAHETRLPAAGAFRFELVRDLDDGFEQGSTWRHEPGVVARPDPWHLSALRNHTPAGGQAWHCGEAAGEYAPMTAARLSTDTYALGAAASARVWSWIDAEPNGPNGAFDGGVVQIHIEGGDTELLVPTSGYPRRMAETTGTNVLEPGTPCLSGRSTGWELLEFDLSAYAGQRVQLQFLFAADNVATPFAYTGWTLDDFALDPGQIDPTGTGDLQAVGPRRLLAGPPSPNPFNPHVRFVLQVPSAAHVELQILDVRGRLVRSLVDAPLAAGTLSVSWDGRDAKQQALASGVYYYRVRSPLGTESGRVILTR